MTAPTASTTQTSLVEALEASCAAQSQRAALVYGDQILTYQELGQAIKKLARSYRRMGIQPGDRIACSVSNRPEQIIALGAAWACGALHVGIDYDFTPYEISSVLDLTKAKLLVLQPGASFSDLRILSENHADLRILIVGERFSEEAESLRSLIESDIADGEPAFDSYPSPEAPCLIFISSGTTGKPKATVGFHGNLSQRWQRLAAWLRFGPSDVHLAHLPLSHGFGLMMAIATLLTGGKLILLDRFSGDEALQAVSTHGVTVFNGSPTHFKLLLKAMEGAACRSGKLRLSVGTAAFFSPELINLICDRLGVQFMFMYGSSEGVGVATTDREDMLKGSVGRPSPGSVMVVGEDRQPLPIGQTGEIAFSRRVFPVRYWEENGADPLNAEGETPSDDRGVWYYSGDMGRLDEDGRLYVYGRVKHQIDRGGLKIDPVEVEMALARCSGVNDAAVVGRPNPVLGETVCACVVGDQKLTLPALRSVLQSQLAAYKLPEQLVLLKLIPRTQLGKVDLTKLKSEIALAEPR